MADGFERFVNTYKGKTYQEIIESIAEIGSSPIMKYEESLKESITNIDSENNSAGQLVDQKKILERLIEENSPASKELQKRLDIIVKVLNKEKYNP